MRSMLTGLAELWPCVTPVAAISRHQEAALFSFIFPLPEILAFFQTQDLSYIVKPIKSKLGVKFLVVKFRNSNLARI